MNALDILFKTNRFNLSKVGNTLLIRVVLERTWRLGSESN